jgi:hypothetical protein
VLSAIEACAAYGRVPQFHGDDRGGVRRTRLGQRDRGADAEELQYGSRVPPLSEGAAQRGR